MPFYRIMQERMLGFEFWVWHGNLTIDCDFNF